MPHSRRPSENPALRPQVIRATEDRRQRAGGTLALFLRREAVGDGADDEVPAVLVRAAELVIGDVGVAQREERRVALGLEGQLHGRLASFGRLGHPGMIDAARAVALTET